MISSPVVGVYDEEKFGLRVKNWSEKARVGKPKVITSYKLEKYDCCWKQILGYE